MADWTTIAYGTLHLTPANETVPGIISTGAQVVSGTKQLIGGFTFGDSGTVLTNDTFPNQNINLGTCCDPGFWQGAPVIKGSRTFYQDAPTAIWQLHGDSIEFTTKMNETITWDQHVFKINQMQADIDDLKDKLDHVCAFIENKFI